MTNDPTFNRLTDDIHQAVKQFDAVNKDQKYPNVLAFVNHDITCDFGDLVSVLTGNFYVEGGTVHPIYTQFSSGRIRSEKKRVHLYIWLDDHRPERFFFNRLVETHATTLRTLFSVDPNKIKKVPF